MDECPACGLAYCDFRTDLTYREVYSMFWSASDDPATWRHKRRHTILGKWRQIKLELWREHREECNG